MYEPQSDFQDWCNENLRQIAVSKDIRLLLAQAFEGGRVAEREACAEVAKETVCDMHLGTGIKIYGTDYERGFIDGMSHQARSSVDRAVNAMAHAEAQRTVDAIRKGT